jgi:hypothetical protein
MGKAARGDKGEWRRGWIQVLYIWYIITTVVNVAMYPTAIKKEEKNK